MEDLAQEVFLRGFTRLGQFRGSFFPAWVDVITRRVCYDALRKRRVRPEWTQERAERISRELVRNGVNPQHLMPVGYGETEAAYPSNAQENERSLDRRVMVFRLR